MSDECRPKGGLTRPMVRPWPGGRQPAVKKRYAPARGGKSSELVAACLGIRMMADAIILSATPENVPNAHSQQFFVIPPHAASHLTNY